MLEAEGKSMELVLGALIAESKYNEKVKLRIEVY